MRLSSCIKLLTGSLLAAMLSVVNAAQLAKFAPLKIGVDLPASLGSCTGGPSAVCTVIVTVKPLDGCTVDIPGDIHIRDKASTPRMVWKLNTTSDGVGGTYGFHGEYGILILIDDDGARGTQLKGNKEGLGAGPGPSTDTSLFHWKKHNNSKRNGQVFYLPVVIRKDAQGVLTVCNATDPRIVND